MNIIGHSKIINFLNRSIEKNSLSQAYLFSGPQHVGKFTVALDFTKKITGVPEAKINPDLIIIEPEKVEEKGKVKIKDIKVEAIRDLERNLSLAPYFGHRRAAIINDADYLTVSAQNALLKTLEEPPKDCVIIIIAHDAMKIMPTVRSRCLIKKFGLVYPDSHREGENMVDWSLGRPGLAQEEGEDRKKMLADLEKIITGNLNGRFIIAEALSKNSTQAINSIEFWMAVLRENILSRPAFFSLSAEKSLKLIEEMGKSIKLMKETNSNSKIVLESLFLNF